MRGEQLARQWQIIRILESRKYGISAAELAEELKASVRTVYRDIDTLMFAGFPITNSNSGKGFSWLEGHRFRVPPPFTVSEMMSLWLYRDLLKVFRGTAFHDSLESLFQKVKHSLPPATLNYLDRIEAGFSVGIKPYKEYGRLKEILNQVNLALLKSKSIEIAYKALNAEQETLRKVDPYNIWFFEGTLYLIAHCHLRGQIRMFVLDRMRLVRMTDEQFEVPADFNIDDYMRHSFKVIHDEIQTVKVRISPAWAAWVGEKIWHESQKTKKLDDGSLEITFQVAGLQEIKMWVLSMGKEAEVLKPAALRMEILSETSKVAEKYQDTTEGAFVSGLVAASDLRRSGER
jgi:predicted DNA-binding transcriptional regulator YafY